MKKIEKGNLTYTQKDIIIGNKKRRVLVIDKKPEVKLSAPIRVSSTSAIIKPKNKTVRKKTCGGCSRKRRG